MTTLTGIHGGRGSGKDTAFRMLHEQLTGRGESADRRGFADALKLSFARLFIPSISLEEAVIWCDELKQDADLDRPAYLTVRWGGLDDQGTLTTVEHRITGRQALQRYGTEGHRDVFDDNFWVDALLPVDTLKDENDVPTGPRWPWNFVGFTVSSFIQDTHPPDHAFITDTRFPNEAERIHLLGGLVYGIRPVGNAEFRDLHSSEIPLADENVDRWIENPWGEPDRFQQNLIEAWEEDRP